MKKALVIVHQTTSDLGRVGQMLVERGYALSIPCPSNQETLPAKVEDHGTVAVFGDPMNANDEQTLPFIRTELDWIPTVLEVLDHWLGMEDDGSCAW